MSPRRTPQPRNADPGRDGRRLAADLTLAMLRLPWTLGFWTLQQMTDLARSDRPLSRTVRDLHTLSETAAEPLDGPLREIHRAGEQLQAGMVDSAVHWASGDWRQAQHRLDEAWRHLSATRDEADRSGRRGGQ